MELRMTDEEIFIRQLFAVRGVNIRRIEAVYDVLQLNGVGGSVIYGQGTPNAVYFVRMQINTNGAQPSTVQFTFSNPIIGDAFNTPNNYVNQQYAGNNTTVYTIPTPYVQFQELNITPVFGSGGSVQIQGYKVYIN